MVRIPKKGAYQLSANTNVAARDTPSGNLQSVYVTLFVNQTPVLKSAQFAAGATGSAASSSGTTQILELEEEDLVYAYAELPNDPVTTEGFLNNWLAPLPQTIAGGGAIPPELLGSGGPTTVISGSFFELLRLEEGQSWMQTQAAEPQSQLSQVPRRIPFSNSQGPLSSCLTNQSLFVAPSSGVYQFDSNVTIFSNWTTEVNAYVFLMLNGLPAWMLSQMSAGPGGSFLSGAQLSQTMHLEEGDCVSLEAASPSGVAMFVIALLPSPAIPEKSFYQPCATWWAAKFLGGSSGASPMQWLRLTLGGAQSLASGQRRRVAFAYAEGPSASSFIPQTSSFLAPSSGLYEFKACLTLFATSTSAQSVQLILWVNDEEIITQSQLVGKTPSGTAASVSLTKLLSVNAGDQVYFTLSSGSAGSLTILPTITLAPGSPPVPSSWWTCRFLQ